MDLLHIVGMLLRRDPKLTRDDVIFFLCLSTFILTVIFMTAVTFTVGDMPSFLRLIFRK